MSAWTPLSEVTVIDLSQQLPGPFATLLLRTLGARVIKVEPPGGDPAREIDPPMFARLVAGKEVVVLDLKREDERKRLHDLVASADVFLEGFRPGVVGRLGADWETLSALNSRLVYCSLSGFGSAGPLAERPGHDLNFLALAAGLPAGLSDGEALIRVPWVDLAAGTNAALTIMAALLDRGATGEGRRLDIAMLDAAAVWSAVKLPREGAEGAYGVFAAADDGRVAVSVLEEAMWKRLCAAFGWTDWLEDPAMANHDQRRARADEIAARLTREIAARPSAEVVELAMRFDVAISRVNELDEAAADPQIAARTLFPDAASWRPLGPSAPVLSLDPPSALV